MTIKLTGKALEAAQNKLRAQLPEGTNLYLVRRNITRSQYTWHHFSVYTINSDGTPNWLTKQVADLTPFRYAARSETLAVRGSGFNHAQDVTENISYRLYGRLDAFKFHLLT